MILEYELQRRRHINSDRITQTRPFNRNEDKEDSLRPDKINRIARITKKKPKRYEEKLPVLTYLAQVANSEKASHKQ